MSKFKNISGGSLDVPVLGRAVEDGEIVDLPDFQPDGESPLSWHPPKWETVPEPKAAKGSKQEGM